MQHVNFFECAVQNINLFKSRLKISQKKKEKAYRDARYGTGILLSF